MRKTIPDLVKEIEASHADSLKLRDRLEIEPFGDEPFLSREIRRRMVEYCGRFLNLLRAMFEKGDSPPTEILAWFGRCFFELDVRCQWVYESLENAESFNALADLQFDKFWEGLKRLKAEDKELAASIDRRIADDRARREKGTLGMVIDLPRMDRPPGPAPRSLRLRQMAKDLGREDDYLAYYALHSDFSHPTPLLVMKAIELVHFHPFKVDITAGAVKHAKATLSRLSEPHPGLVEDQKRFKASFQKSLQTSRQPSQPAAESRKPEEKEP